MARGTSTSKAKNAKAEPDFTRPALAPGLLGAIALLVGLALLDVDAFTIVRYVVSILAIIMCVFVFQARGWWWLPGLLAIAVVWNPVLVIELHGQGWVSFQFIAAIYFVVVGVVTKVRDREDQSAR